MPRLSPSAAGALAACLTAAGLVAGCRDTTPPPTPPPTTAVPDSGTFATADTLGAGVDTRTATMRVEGIDRPVALTAFDADGVPFTTFLPRGEFETRTTTGSDGRAEVTFAWAAERGPSGEPRATVTVAPSGVSPDSLLAAFVREGAGQGRTVADAGASPCLWAVEGHAFTDEVSGMTGIVCVGTHRGRAFRLTTEADPERADGFAARLDVLLREWRWRDTGLGLEDGPAL